MIQFSGTYTDLYELTMAQVYFFEGLEKNQAVFDYFFRKLPYEGGFAIFCGLEDFLDIIESLSFTKEDLEYLLNIGFKKNL
jgi:nicotinate phosphoribosyltransferase